MIDRTPDQCSVLGFGRVNKKGGCEAGPGAAAGKGEDQIRESEYTQDKMMDQKEDISDQEDSSSDMEDPTAGNWTHDTPPQTAESAGTMQSLNADPAVPPSPKPQHLTFNPVVQERQVQLEMETVAPEPVTTPTPHFTRIAPSIPQQNPQQLTKLSIPTPPEGRKVEEKTHHMLNEATRIPVAVQVNSTMSHRYWLALYSLSLASLYLFLWSIPLREGLAWLFGLEFGSVSLGYIVAVLCDEGSFTVELKRRPTRFIMKAGLLMNGVSAVATAIGIIIYSISLLFTPAPDLVYFSTSTFSLTIALLLFTVLEMAITVIVAFYNYKSLYHFQNAYTVLHDVIAKHPSHSRGVQTAF
ncbi:hypothetical protein chiPu_0021017 [Chiloscyllium punctatum]|uniref:Uncharacterized protein n=1 Tax=Chiloscyllium punctatum TaxID=137246 RepID=A0A401RMD6_CHIPU|nr:hypothetical protein [Chiloscyllium punctatum]